MTVPAWVRSPGGWFQAWLFQHPFPGGCLASNGVSAALPSGASTEIKARLNRAKNTRLGIAMEGAQVGNPQCKGSALASARSCWSRRRRHRFASCPGRGAGANCSLCAGPSPRASSRERLRCGSTCSAQEGAQGALKLLRALGAHFRSPWLCRSPHPSPPTSS